MLEVKPNVVIKLDDNTTIALMGNAVIANIEDGKIVNQYFSPTAHNVIVEAIIKNAENYPGFKYKSKNKEK